MLTTPCCSEFTLPLGFTSATIVVSGVGYHELFLNGNKVARTNSTLAGHTIPRGTFM
jgi:hypothetical protein